jgi:hypothetical protein
MKLLSSRETENNNKNQSVAEATRIMEIRSQLSREERELNEKRKQFDAQWNEIQADFEGKILSYHGTLSDLEREVDALQAKRDELLKPLDDFPEKIKENVACTDELIQYLTKRKKEVNSEHQKLTKWQKDLKLESDRVFERSAAVAQGEESLKAKQILQKQEEERINLASESMAQNANRRQTELSLFEGSLRKKEVELAGREKVLADEKVKLANDRQRLESQQQTLIAAYNEARNKNII